MKKTYAEGLRDRIWDFEIANRSTLIFCIITIIVLILSLLYINGYLGAYIEWLKT